ncbi:MULTISPECIES: aminotransferase class III-fold pyridoxal phosphate-dependent enzyme [Streptomyces]|uniref:aminotransferase class III-fold pyridoxal phosphate-dependent enzyme n=1 Tax=Streptomyces TaxID=1883 RepID=UPI0006899E06|nr:MULTISPECIES: aminotransferase class III-fold pyridoxal phosphate-dependent enzyme [Streptomyces]
MNPHVERLLTGLGLDVAYVRGRGTRLHDADGRAYLDFAGAYGALPFGHDPEVVWTALDGMRRAGEPSLTQPSLPVAARELADRLAARTGLPHAFFTNSGAESVEAAIKVVRAATGRLLVVSAEDSFHGKTLGALSATGRATYQRPFGAPADGFVTVPFGDVGALRALFAERGGEIAGLLLEPVQGEGGVRPAPPGYLAEARRLCSAHGARLVFDEVQTGLGRTGRMFAYEHAGVVPDVLALAKALGGGVVPIGAVLYSDDCLTEDFALRHTSTFGGNTLCARVGIAAFDLLTADGERIVAESARKGARLRAGLRKLAEAHPGLVTDVRGEGLLLGLELTDDPREFGQQGLLRSLAHAQGLAAVLCGHLLRAEGIRVAPAYFAARVIRVEPPLTVTDEECDEFLAALDRALGRIAAGDSAALFAHLTGGGPAGAGAPARPRPRPRPVPRRDEPRWAFIGHPTDDESYESFDPALGLPGHGVKRLFDRLELTRSADTPAGMLVGASRLTSDDGRSSYGELFALPYDARALLDLPTARAAALIGRAVAEAAERGARIVGLGAYTSVVTAGGTLLGATPVPVTTGNAYTAASALDGIARTARDRGLDLRGARCVVLGAAGSVGRAMTLLLAEEVGSLVLVGNPRSGRAGLARLDAVAAEIRGDLVPETTTAAAEAIAGADLVVAATSSPGLLIDPATPKPGAIICDVSQPANAGPELAEQRPDLAVFAGGLVELPGRQDFGLDVALPPGVIWACTAETVILSQLDGELPLSRRGDRLDIATVARLRTEGARLGFRLHLPTPPTRSHP